MSSAFVSIYALPSLPYQSDQIHPSAVCFPTPASSLGQSCNVTILFQTSRLVVKVVIAASLAELAVGAVSGRLVAVGEAEE